MPHGSLKETTGCYHRAPGSSVKGRTDQAESTEPWSTNQTAGNQKFKSEKRVAFFFQKQFDVEKTCTSFIISLLIFTKQGVLGIW